MVALCKTFMLGELRAAWGTTSEHHAMVWKRGERLLVHDVGGFASDSTMWKKHDRTVHRANFVRSTILQQARSAENWQLTRHYQWSASNWAKNHARDGLFVNPLFFVCAGLLLSFCFGVVKRSSLYQTSAYTRVTTLLTSFARSWAYHVGYY